MIAETTTHYMVIGTGSIGERHFQNLKKLGGSVSQFSWRNHSIEAIENHCVNISIPKAMVIATATSVRSELFSLCIKYNIPFYVEKPVCFSDQDLSLLAAMPLALKQKSMAGFMMRYHPMVQFLADEIEGDVIRGNVEIGHDVREWRDNWRFSDSYAASPNGGGVLLDLCHEIDILNLLFNGLVLQDVYSLGHKDFDGVDFATKINFTNDVGAQLSVSMDYVSPNLIRTGCFMSNSKILRYDLKKGIVEVEFKGRNQFYDFQFDRNDMFLNIMKDFMSLVEGRHIVNTKLVPCLYHMDQTNTLIAEAWKKRKFSGNIEMDVM